MAILSPPSRQPINRRHFFKVGMAGAAGLVLYSGEIARHWIEVTQRDVFLRNLPAAFDGLRIAQISDIHMDEFTEPFFLRHVVDRINRLHPDAVVLTGDFVTVGIGKRHFAVGSAWQCAAILKELACRQIYAVLGNHDFIIGAKVVAEALTSSGIAVLRNAYMPMERAGDRIWLAGLDDPVEGRPNPELAIPASTRNQANEPVVLLCHAPDYADLLLTHPAGQAVDLMLSGHTHGGQVRLPFLGALTLPAWGKKYVEGFFRLGGLQLYVNRGIGTVGLPFRLNCPPEITLLTLRRG
ncbi:MAG: metallophosphoesterase [Terracidiphilus sp.]|nr:metallophosphoesterase [Terracidiphilus sp.]